MIFRSKPPIRRTGRGIEVHLGSEERDVLRTLVGDHRRQLLEDSDAAEFRRLFPTAYLDDPQRDAEYQILARSELLDSRVASLDTVLATVDAGVLDDDELSAWMGSVNQLRLTFGTRLDIGEEDDDEIDPTDPEAGERVVYHYLTYLLHLLVEASAY